MIFLVKSKKRIRAPEVSPWKSILTIFPNVSGEEPRGAGRPRRHLPMCQETVWTGLTIFRFLVNSVFRPSFPAFLENAISWFSSKIHSFDTHLDAVFYCEEKYFLRPANERTKDRSKISWFWGSGSQITYVFWSLDAGRLVLQQILALIQFRLR